MVDEHQVFEAADALRAAGRLVSVRSVRVGLGGTGSYRDIGPAVARWKAACRYEPRLGVEGIPTEVRDGHDKALSETWAAARAEASRELEDVRTRMREAVRANDEVRDEALQKADRLADEVSELRAEVARLRGRLDRRDAHVGRMRSETFWNRTMQDVFDLMPPEGAMTVEQILARLRDGAWRETASHGVNLTAGALRKRMRTRATYERFFVARDDGTFERRDPPNRGAMPPDIPERA